MNQKVSKKFQILSLSGGGYRGLHIAQLLEIIEDKIDGRIALLDKMLEASYNDKVLHNIMTIDAVSWRSMASLFLRHNKRRFMGGQSL